MAAAPGMGLPLLGPARRAEADDPVRAVAERAHPRLAAAAERDRAPRDLDLAAVLVGQPERPPDEQRAVAVGRDRRGVAHRPFRPRGATFDTRPAARRTGVAGPGARGMRGRCFWRDAGSWSRGC